MAGHKPTLEEICKPKNLKRIGEHGDGLKILLKEPQLYGNRCNAKSPDLILGYTNGEYTVAELKRGMEKYDYALQQIENGIELLVEHFNIDPDQITGKVILYGGGVRYEVTHEKGRRISGNKKR